MEHNYDVIIVGSGPAGIAAAIIGKEYLERMRQESIV